jgi:hypothetical protein
MDRYSYIDRDFEKWLRELGPILRSADETERVQRKYLSADEIKEIEKMLLGL